MEEWKEYKLGDVANVTKLAGYEFTKYVKYIPTGEIIAVRALNLRDGQMDLHDIQRISKDVSESLVRSKLYKNEIVLSYTGTIGACAIITEDDKFHLAPNVCKITPLPNVNPYYIYYIIRSKRFQDQLSGYAHGSTQPTIPMKTIREIPIRLCNIEDQNKIAKVLKPLDDKIELNRLINENLEAQAQALFKSWFVDFEPFRDGEFVESELGMIPKGWRVGTLSDYGSIICGKTPPKAESTFYGGNIPFIKIPDMHNNVFVIESEDHLSSSGDESQIGKRIPPYSILVSCIATVGLVCMNTQMSHTNQQINTIVPKFSRYRYYLYQKLSSMKEQLINLGRGGTATLNVNTKQFGSIRVLKPLDKVLEDYTNIITSIYNKIEINYQESRRLATLRDTLLPRLMSGEIKVGDATL